ncbi:TauD/TfdA family dioxygenase [Spongiimicrobium salis]|uniref:TauD/TfdA family dioxygenase n=1 Tax=Spongiimicrobium salis TaxID=1667022 RepID=UPI00374DEED2
MDQLKTFLKQERGVYDHTTSLPIEIILADLSKEEFISFYRKNKELIENNLMVHGAIKFRGVAIDSIDSFQEITHSISTKFLSYIDGNSPRTKLTGSVYTSTEYDASQKITMHNELSYSKKWPGKIFFSCITPAQMGGETLLADSRTILQKMDKEIVSEIGRKGVTYVRNLHGGTGMGPSWMDTFETNDKQELENYCTSYDIDFSWKENDLLHVKQSSKGILQHRTTNESVWFNQIDQFHPLHLGDELYETMLLMYESPENFPMYVTYGDGTIIPSEVIQKILETIEIVTVAPQWDRNELLMVDNELIAHGRNPFKGDRKVVVAMSE